MTEGQKTSIQILEYLEAGLPFNHDLSAPIRFAAFFQNWREIPVTAYVIPEFQRWGSSCIIAAILGTEAATLVQISNLTQIGVV
ncbi:predicted protein [Sclerotinia sclerotiorum 1980 UF-70]|uniref:Uncharacterized protein n=1 Tax=Sclerotinia sclerotiorum (strain ATCC 18683 / 1980 / Ss-1) TaxID=665079 RepID=A7ECU3_SCLS1|nr:predicted protein [Sclerotinia sclerotiorum 1980 UF-70]EDO00659.1 predicted protein [Sclerotinia sclerotiorum 1980 UF-70]